MLKNIKTSKIIAAVLVFVLVVFVAINAFSAEKEIGGGIIEGNIQADEVVISSKVPGRIGNILVQEGEEVEKGKILLQIETTELEAKQEQAQGALMAAQAIYEKAVNGARPEEISLAQGNVDMAMAKLNLLESTYKRLKNLHEAGACTTNDLEKAEAELLAARAQAKQAKDQLNMALQGARYEDIMAAKANVIRAQGVLKEVENGINEATIKSPGMGTITTMYHKEGELIASGTPLFTITNYQDIWVEVNMTENEIESLEVGKKAKIIHNGVWSEGEIINISRNPDFAVIKATNEMSDKDTITYMVKIKVLETQNIFPGMRVNVEFSGKE